MSTPKHTCGNRELRVSRLLLALHSGDGLMYRKVVDEIAGCAMCWEMVAHWAISLLAGSRALAAGGNEAAAEHELAGIDQVLTITNAPW